jgi:hypothetical protein
MKQKIFSYLIKKVKKFELIVILFFLIFYFFPSLDLKIKEKKLKKKLKKKRKSKFQESIKYKQDDLTIVTAYYKIKSKHSYSEYLRRLKDFMRLNHSIVFFYIKNFYKYYKRDEAKIFA